MANTIQKESKTIYLQIGQNYENLGVQKQFDVSEWTAEFPDAHIYLLFKRPGEEAAAPVNTTLDEDGILTWTVSNWETGIIGIGFAEIRAINSTTGLVKKSHVIPCSIEASVTDEDAAPDYPSWVDRMLQFGENVDSIYATLPHELEEGIASIQQEAQTQTEAIEQKGITTRASIPADYTTLSDDITDLKSAFAPTSNAFNSVYSFTEQNFVPIYTQGRIDSHTDPVQIVSADTTKVITEQILDLTGFDGLKITVDSGYQFNVLLYANDLEASYIKATGWVTSYEIEYSLNRRKRIYVRKSDSSSITPADAQAHIHIVLTQTDMPSRLVNASIQNEVRDYANSFIFNGYPADTQLYASASYKSTPIFRAIPGDTIKMSGGSANGIRIFATLNKYGDIVSEVTGTGNNNVVTFSHTFTSEEMFFVLSESTLAIANKFLSVQYISQYTNGVKTAISNVDKTNTLTDFYDTTEIGGINSGTNPPGWNHNITTRVMVMYEHPINLDIGGKIYLSDYTNAKIFVVWKNTSDTWKSRGWITNGEFVAEEKGQYWFTLVGVPEATITDKRTLTSLVRVLNVNGVQDTLNNTVMPYLESDYIIKSICHRGYGRVAPENTLPAFTLASKLGWKYMETDVRFTSDGVPVLLHDETINRTARNADGTEISETINIADITYEQALTYDFGVWMGTQYAGIKIPTLAEFLIHCKRLSVGAYIEIKDETGNRVKQVVDTVRRYGMLDYSTFLAFSYSALQKVTAEHPKARLGLLSGVISQSVIDTLNTIKTEDNEVFLDASHTAITDEWCSALASSGFMLEAYTPNALTTILNIDPYISGITSDYIVAGSAIKHSYV